jgi:hypothetical protein
MQSLIGFQLVSTAGRGLILIEHRYASTGSMNVVFMILKVLIV